MALYVKVAMSGEGGEQLLVSTAASAKDELDEYAFSCEQQLDIPDGGGDSLTLTLLEQTTDKPLGSVELSLSEGSKAWRVLKSGDDAQSGELQVDISVFDKPPPPVEVPARLEGEQEVEGMVANSTDGEPAEEATEAE